MKILKFLISGEFMLAAFLLANIFKSGLPDLPIDLNVILFIITVAIAVKRLIFNSEISNLMILPLALYTVFATYCLVSFLYSPSQIYGMQKIMILFTFTTWCFMSPFFLVNTSNSLKRFLKSFLIISAITSLYAMITFDSEGIVGERLGIAGANTIGLGRAAALGVIILIFTYLINLNISKVKKCVSFLTLILLLVVLFLTGARMALISLVVVILIYMLMKIISIKDNNIHLSKTPLKILSLFIVIPFFLIPFWNYLQLMITRLTNLFNISGFGSYSQRTDLYLVAVELWTNNIFTLIFGGGIGSFTIFLDGIDERYYPHNIFLEIVSELGIIGLILFLLLLCIPFYINNLFKLNNLQIIIFLMFIYTFLNANTTGDLNDNRMMFTFLSLMYMHPLFKEKM